MPMNRLVDSIPEAIPDFWSDTASIAAVLEMLYANPSPQPITTRPASTTVTPVVASTRTRMPAPAPTSATPTNIGHDVPNRATILPIRSDSTVNGSVNARKTTPASMGERPRISCT